MKMSVLSADHHQAGPPLSFDLSANKQQVHQATHMESPASKLASMQCAKQRPSKPGATHRATCNSWVTYKLLLAELSLETH
jgi:hypothetical protein